MNIRKEELVLYALSLLEEDDRPNVSFSKENLAYALDISVNTLDLYFTKLTRRALIVRHKRKYYDDLRQTVETTDEGRNIAKEVIKKLEEEYLTPERHNVHSIVKATVILDRIQDLLEKIFFMSLLTQVLRFDLPLYLQTIKTTKQENNVVNILSEMDDNEIGNEVPVVETFFRSCLYGMRKDSDLLKDCQYSQDPSTLLIIAEATTKQGRYTEARSVYEYILSTKVPITQNQWTIAKINLAYLDSKEGRFEGSLSDLQNLMDSIDNKIFISYIKQVMGKIYAASGDYDKAIELYTEALNSFRKFGLPLLIAITYNNRGVGYYYKENVDQAESDWLSSRKFAKEANSRYLEGAICCNLADVELLRGDLRKSWDLCDMGSEIFSEVSDLEGVAWAEFQKAVYFLHTKDLKKALVHYQRSESIAFPSPSPGERRFRRKYFIERGELNGFNEEQLSI